MLIMDWEEIKALSNEHEGQFLEFKRSARDLADEMAAFANADGGRIVIGGRG